MGRPSRWWGWILAVPIAVAATGCISVRMVQREGCWVKQTDRGIFGTKEVLGPCQRPAQAWAADPVIRAVQECVAQADYRWQARAMEAWSQGVQMPDREGVEDGVLEGCLSGPLREALAENASLRTQLEGALEDRSMLHLQTQEDRLFLQGSHERIATALGEAANKPPGTATATSHSTSEGVARVVGDLRASSEQRKSSTREPPALEGQTPGGHPAPLELMRNEAQPPDAAVPVIPVDTARPMAPPPEAGAAQGPTAGAREELWRRLEERDSEAERTARASREDAPNGKDRGLAREAPVPARAVRAEASAVPEARASPAVREVADVTEVSAVTEDAGASGVGRSAAARGPSERGGAPGLEGPGGPGQGGSGAAGTAAAASDGGEGCPVPP